MEGVQNMIYEELDESYWKAIGGMLLSDGLVGKTLFIMKKESIFSCRLFFHR